MRALQVGALTFVTDRERGYCGVCCPWALSPCGTGVDTEVTGGAGSSGLMSVSPCQCRAMTPSIRAPPSRLPLWTFGGNAGQWPVSAIQATRSYPVGVWGQWRWPVFLRCSPR